MPVAPRKRQLATNMRHVVKGQNRKSQSCELRRPVIVIEAMAPKLIVVLRDIVVENAKYSVSEALVEAARLKAVRIQPCASTITSFRFSLRLKRHLSTETGASQRLRDK